MLISLDSITKHFKLISNNMLLDILFGLTVMISHNISYCQFGNTYMNRNYPGLEQLIGMFANMFVIKLDINLNDSLSDYIIRQKKTCINYYNLLIFLLVMS